MNRDLLPLPFLGFFERFSNSASTIGPRVDAAFWALVAVSVLLVGVLVVLNLIFLVQYRHGSGAARRPLGIAEWKIEAFWIVATTVGFLGFFYWGASIYLDLERAPAGAYEINVVGRQWMWDVRHPNGRREFDQLHVPVNQAVRLVLSSEDVIHSFFVPAFRIKQDVVPGKIVSTWFNATHEGVYHLFCTQFCGTKHEEMGGQVVVMSPEGYAQWLEQGNISGASATRGRELYTRYGCSGCHDQPSPIHAPSLENVYQRLVPVQDGRFVRADDQYLRDSILLPGKDLVAGYQPIMPSFQGVIPEGDLLELLSYLRSLSKSPTPSSSPASSSVPLSP
jgi:cytochrome c oxidase subunit 2